MRGRKQTTTSVASLIRPKGVPYEQSEYIRLLRHQITFMPHLDTISTLRSEITFMPSAAQRCIEVRRPFANHNKNPDFSAYHAHFLLWLDAEVKTVIIHFTENSLKGKSDNQTVNTFLEHFNPVEGGVTYILNEINLNADGFDLIWRLV